MSAAVEYPELSGHVSNDLSKPKKKSKGKKNKGTNKEVAPPSSSQDITAAVADDSVIDETTKEKGKGKEKTQGKAASVEDDVEEVGGEKVDVSDADDSMPDKASAYSETSGSSDSEADPDEDPKITEARKVEKRAAKAADTDESRKARRLASRHRRTMKDEIKRVKTANKGIAGYKDNRENRKPPMPRPVQVERLWARLYPLVKKWWAEGGKDIPASHTQPSTR
jgi:hypothetical protein